MLKIAKQDIFQLPISHLNYRDLRELEQQCRDCRLANHSSWILPQLIAWFGSWEVLPTARETLLHNCDTDLKRTLYSLALVSRGAVVLRQTLQPEHSALVPLILSGQKKMRGRTYESWRSYPGLELLVHKPLLEAARSTPPTLSRERLLELRTAGLLHRAGERAGTPRAAASSWRLYHMQDTELGGLPPLAQTMLTQIWVASPQLRSQQMILDPASWDALPDPLLSPEIFLQ